MESKLTTLGVNTGSSILNARIGAFNTMVENLPLAVVREINYNIYSTEEIDRIAAVTIVNADATGNGSVNDPALGSHSKSDLCDTCGQGIKECNGHYGKINIPKLMNPIAIKTIVDVLNCVCRDCGKLLVDKQTLMDEGVMRLKKSNRLTRIVNLVASNDGKCTRKVFEENEKECSITPLYYSADSKLIYLQYTYSKQKKKNTSTDSHIYPDKIYNILNVIDDEDAAILGFEKPNHPRNMIMERMIVMPYCVRPSTRLGATEKVHDFTNLYKDIMRAVIAYNASSPELKRDRLRDIYSKISALIKNDGVSSNRNGVPTIDLNTTINGKTAIIKSNMMGKRVNYAGRTVIGPGPDLRVDEIGLPRLMAEKLTRPFLVTEATRVELQSMYDEGRVKKIIMKTSRRGKSHGFGFQVNDKFKEDVPDLKLELGDIVERTLQNGDIVLVNRQPSLHKQSVLAVYVRITEERIVTINLSITTPLNADFDGDEINIHVLQDIKAYTEAANLIAVSNNLISNEDNTPMMGIVYDSLSAVYLLTMFQDRYDIMKEKILKGENLNAEERDEIIEIIFTYNVSCSREVCEALGVQRNRLRGYNLIDNWEELTEDERSELKGIIEEEGIVTSKEILMELNVKYRSSKMSLLWRGASLAGLDGYVNDIDHIMMDEDLFSDGLLSILNSSVSPFSQKDEAYSRERIRSLAERCLSKGVPWGSMRAYVSSVFPPDFYYNKKGVRVDRGIMVKGTLSKATVGNTNGSMIAEMVKSHGGRKTVDFMSEIQFISRDYLLHYGLSVGLLDCVPVSDKFKEDIEKKVGNVRLEIESLEEDALAGRIDNVTLEAKIAKKFANLKTYSDNLVMQNLPKKNSIAIMANSGAKGKLFNLTQMHSLIGQQNVAGRRIPQNLPGGRSHVSFQVGSTDPASRGFCASSFSSGLNPVEFFWHMQSTREGLIDTAINTGATGYLQAQLVKFMEDIQVAGDGSVRDAYGGIVQFVYGGDGLNAGELQNVKIGNINTPFFRDVDHLINNLNSKYAGL